MSKLSVFPDLAAAREQAALWIVRMDRGLSAAEQPEFSQWLRGPANRRAFEELGGLWDDMDVVSVLAEVCPRPAGRTLRRALQVALGTAAAAVLAALVLQFMPRNTEPPVAQLAATGMRVEAFATAIGEQRTVTLRDGSLLTLNTDSLVEVSLSEKQRQLNLLRGEAHFEVAHDVTRPFVVAAGALAARAVGTAFNIRLRAGQAADVLVTSGIVQVSGSAPGSTPDSLLAGQLLELKPDGTREVQQLDATALESRLAWRRSVLIFDGETLAQALSEIARYTPRHIYLADSRLGNVRIAGYFPADNLPVLLGSLRANFGIVATDTDTGLRLSAATERQPQQ